MTRRLVWCVGVLSAVCATDGAGQSATNALDPATLRRSSFTWSQAEREFGFANWDAIYSGRIVPRGVEVRRLPSGTPLVALRPGTVGAQTIRQLMTMTSSVKWNEDYTDPTSDIARFYSEPGEPGLDATVSYMRKLPREAHDG